MTGEILADKFFQTFPRRGTDGSKIDRIKAALNDTNGGAFAAAADELARQYAQLLIELTGLKMARSYERGYPVRGPASAVVRKDAVTISPAKTPADLALPQRSE